MTRNGNKKTNKKYKVDYLRVILIIGFIYFAVTFVRQQLRINEYNVKIESTRQDIASAENKIEELKDKKDKVNDSEYIEKIAREEFGLVKPYEKIFVDVDK